MKCSVWSRSVVGASVVTMLALSGAGVRAEEDPLGLKLSGAISRDRFFVRAGGIYVKVRTKSGDTYDSTGPVLTQQQLAKVFSLEKKANGTWGRIEASPNTPGATANPETAIAQNSLIVPEGSTVTQSQMMARMRTGPGSVATLLTTMDEVGQTSIGTPPGVQSVASREMGTGGLSLGYYFSDDFTWLVESYVLAAPLRTSAIGRGTTVSVDPNADNPDLNPRKLLVDGQKIVNTKLLPPTLLLGRYWGDKNNKFRPYTGVLATYAIFFDTRATPFLNSYVGGGRPGDTTVSIRNTFGIGPVGGFKYQATDDWHLSLNVGYTRLKTEATITTRNSYFDRNTGAAFDLGELAGTIKTGNDLYNPNLTSSQTLALRQAFEANGGFSGAVSRAVGTAVTGKPNLGTFVRKTELTLDNTLFFLSAGRAF